MSESVATATNPMSLMGPESQELTNELAVLTRMLPFDGASLLELGCGGAEKTRLIANKTGVARIVAAEVDSIQHEKNLKVTDLDKVSFEAFGAEEIPYPDDTFDIVVMFKSLHHVPLDRLDDAMAEIHRVLKPGGYAYISEPVFDGAFNHVMRVFHDEEVVRREAFGAVGRAVERELFELAEEYFFRNRIRFESWQQYETNMLSVTHTEHNLSDEQRAEVERRFEANRSDEGYVFDIPNRVDLLRKA